jgi:hypothetical protein
VNGSYAASRSNRHEVLQMLAAVLAGTEEAQDHTLTQNNDPQSPQTIETGSGLAA